jgi:hypothetical protein
MCRCVRKKMSAMNEASAAAAAGSEDTGEGALAPGSVWGGRWLQGFEIGYSGWEQPAWLKSKQVDQPPAA